MISDFITNKRPPNARTQRAKILDLLASARGEWVPLPKISECAAQYNARIFELRKAGYRIANRTREIDGQRCSWFRLESTPAMTAAQAPTPAGSPPAQPMLFSDVRGARYPD